MDARSKWSILADATQQCVLDNIVSGVLPLYIVTEYPKSGGNWVCQMLADYLGLPFPRNMRASIKSAVHHGHYLYTPFLRNVTCVMRDGRDAIISYYFHALFENDRSSPILVRRTRQALRFSDYENVIDNLPRFIEYVFEVQRKSRSPFQFTWPRFVRSWIHRDVAMVRYEDLIIDAFYAMEHVLKKLTTQEVDAFRLRDVVQRNSFTAQTGRLPGSELKDRFLRKGVAGDWREKFTQPAAELFDELAGAELKMLGYENDNQWVNRCK